MLRVAAKRTIGATSSGLMMETLEPMTGRRTLDHFFRYYDILKLANPCAGDRVLEVGSGSSGIGEFYSGSFVGLDLKFDNPIRTMDLVRGSATRLPFADGAFDVVISSDMIEHLPAHDRSAAIRELIRVSRGRVVVACPQGRAAHLSDVLLASIYRLRRRTPPDWLQEHLANGLPERSHMEAVVRESGNPYAVYRNESVLLHQSVMIAGVLPILGRCLPPFAARLRALSIVLLKVTREMGPAYRNIFLIQRGSNRAIVDTDECAESAAV